MGQITLLDPSATSGHYISLLAGPRSASCRKLSGSAIVVSLEAQPAKAPCPTRAGQRAHDKRPKLTVRHEARKRKEAAAGGEKGGKFPTHCKQLTEGVANGPADCRTDAG